MGDDIFRTAINWQLREFTDQPTPYRRDLIPLAECCPKDEPNAGLPYAHIADRQEFQSLRLGASLTHLSKSVNFRPPKGK